MKLTICGAARKVTGSCYLLETSTKKILIDCGFHQGGRVAEEENFADFPFNPAEISHLVVTHAHLDHTGRIPKLVKDGFSGTILATNPTVELTQIILDDSAHIVVQEARRHKHDPIFEAHDVAKTAALFKGVDYHEPVKLDDNITVEFFDAGHILGSAIVKITADGKTIAFSGDLGNPPVPILRPTETVDEADYVIMESTYGGRIHEDKDNRRLLLQSSIYETIIMGGVLMVPAFAMERTQELLYEINEMIKNKDIPEVPIFLDSPLAIKATNIFKKYEGYFDKETMDIIKSGSEVFNFPGLRTTLTADESKSINSHPSPKVIIAGSGMAHGGRILHHIKRYIGYFANQYLIVGFQVEGSLGRRILDGNKTIKVHGEEHAVKAKVKAIGGYSSHADRDKLTAWVTGFDQAKLKKVFLTHGEESQASALQHHFKQHFDFEPIVPKMLESFDL